MQHACEEHLNESPGVLGVRLVSAHERSCARTHERERGARARERERE